MNTPLEIRLRRRLIIDKKTECWNWQGTKRAGYGGLTIGSRVDGTRKTVSAHRLSFEIFNGQIPDGTEICHSCDNPACINPKHLFAGTRQENVNDRENKGRNKAPIGEINGQAKLTVTDVLSAKRLRQKGLIYMAIAQRFEVDKRTIMRAIKGEQWAHVAAPSIAQDGQKSEGA
jgi:HNH endonuclease